MIKWIKSLFIPKRAIQCGGTGHLAVMDFLDREVGKVFYSRPESDMVLDYTLNIDRVLHDGEKLKKINALPDKRKGIYDTAIQEISLPYAEKIFVSASGFEFKEKDISKYTKEEQFEILKKYHTFYLAKMVDIAFAPVGVLKKKS